MNLLESAGFSRSNPYYVVQQGKVNLVLSMLSLSFFPPTWLIFPYFPIALQIASLTLMKDAERLDLLKEIGGTRVYEERRRESLKIMQETGKWMTHFSGIIVFYFISFTQNDDHLNIFLPSRVGNKRKQIIQVVQYLDERLKELDEEKEELRKYQQLDKQRKSLEYTIYDKELHDARQRLAEVMLRYLYVLTSSNFYGWYFWYLQIWFLKVACPLIPDRWGPCKGLSEVNWDV